MLLTLPEDVLHHVMLHLGPMPQELLRLSRCCVRLHAAVVGAASVWRQLFAAAFPQQQQVQQQQQHADYRELYRQRWTTIARAARLTAKVQRMRLGSDVAHLQRELADLTARLAKERSQCRHLQQQLARAAAAGRAGASGSTWQLAAVRLYHNQVVQQATAVPHAAQLASLQQAVKVSRLEVKTLTAAIAARRGRLATTKRRLAALEG